HRTPAAEVKKVGWRGVMKTVQREGKLVITNHNEPQAVILSAQAYAAIQAALQDQVDSGGSALETLRRRFDERLASLDRPDAGSRLRGVMAAGGTQLNGDIKAGESY